MRAPLRRPAAPFPCGAAGSINGHGGMATQIELSEIELASLREVARGFDQRGIPDNHSRKLIELRLIYKLLGSLRITSAGRRHLASCG